MTEFTVNSTDNPVILYAAGNRALYVLNMMRQFGIKPVCFCDENRALWNTTLAGVPVVGIDTVKERYPDFVMYITVKRSTLLKNIVRELTEIYTIPKNRILNTAPLDINAIGGAVKIQGVEYPDLPRHWVTHYWEIVNSLSVFVNKKYLAPDDFVGKSVLDFGGSHGQLGIALLENGARSATCLDPYCPTDLFDATVSKISGFNYFCGSADEYVHEFPHKQYDLIIAHCVTEHVPRLRPALDAIHRMLGDNGTFFIVHDNYYHPSGSHDNLILSIDPETSERKYSGVECWNQPDKCASTSEFRKKMGSWIWGEEEKHLQPHNCASCPFFKRTHPWGHILFQNDLKNIYMSPIFSNDNLNKILPTELVRLLIETGFNIEFVKKGYTHNTVPKELLLPDCSIHELDLRTVNLFIRAKKGIQSVGLKNTDTVKDARA